MRAERQAGLLAALVLAVVAATCALAPVSSYPHPEPAGSHSRAVAMGLASPPARTLWPTQPPPGDPPGPPPAVTQPSAGRMVDEELYTAITGRSGTASTYGPGWDGWLAWPDGPGYRLHICGAGGCRIGTSNDAGPDLAMQRAGRIIDLDVPTFEAVCGTSWRAGLCDVTVAVLSAPG